LVDDFLADFFCVDGFYFGATFSEEDFLAETTELFGDDLCDTGFTISSSDSDDSTLD
jgi:hypothetical protein